MVPPASTATAATWARCAFLTAVLVGVADYAIGFGIFVALVGRALLGVFQAPAHRASEVSREDTPLARPFLFVSARSRTGPVDSGNAYPYP